MFTYYLYLSRSAHQTTNSTNPAYFVCSLFEYFFQIKALNQYQNANITHYIKKKEPLCNTLDLGNWDSGFVKLGIPWAEWDKSMIKVGWLHILRLFWERWEEIENIFRNLATFKKKQKKVEILTAGGLILTITISAVIVAFRPIQIRVANGIAIKSRYSVIVICQYLYHDSKLFAPVTCYVELAETSLWGTVLGRENAVFT